MSHDLVKGVGVADKANFLSFPAHFIWIGWYCTSLLNLKNKSSRSIKLLMESNTIQLPLTQDPFISFTLMFVKKMSCQAPEQQYKQFIRAVFFENFPCNELNRKKTLTNYLNFLCERRFDCIR